MRISIAYLAVLALAANAAAQQPARPDEAFTGSWQGTLEVGGTRLRLRLDVERDAGGALRGALTSIDQGGQPIPATLTVRGDTLRVAIPAIQATYAATLTAGRDSLRGTFTQMGGSLPLVMTKGMAAETSAPLPYPARFPSDAEIRALLSRRVDEQKRSVGIVVGITEPSGRRIVAYGRPANGDDRALDGSTVFEIGSVTKVFTSLLLAEMARRGEVRLEDPAAQYLPAGGTLPERGRAITLLDLATHTSGLPRLPSNLAPRDPENPYADYSEEQMARFLSGYRLPRDVGASFEYSNLGAGLLGHLLARRAGSDYESALRARVLDPLGMRSTAVTLTPEMRARAAAGHDAGLRPTPYWDLPTLAGAGALRSTANDMLGFVEAALGRRSTPLAPALGDLLATRRATGMPGGEAGLGWQILGQDGHEIVWHNGGTGGFRSFVGLDRARGLGLVILSNSGAAEGVDDIAFHLLRGGGPLYEGKSRTAVPLEPAVFDRYVGRYQLAPTFVMTVSREGDRFFVQATGQPRFEIRPESERDFFLTAVDAQLTFEVDTSGRATALVLHQNGVDQRARRIE